MTPRRLCAAAATMMTAVVAGPLLVTLGALPGGALAAGGMLAWGRPGPDDWWPVIPGMLAVLGAGVGICIDVTAASWAWRRWVASPPPPAAAE